MLLKKLDYLEEFTRKEKVASCIKVEPTSQFVQDSLGSQIRANVTKRMV
jgi:hypothetical protein